MTIEQYVKQNGTYNIFLKPAIGRLEKVLLENESIVYAIGGNINAIDNNEELKIDFWNIKSKMAGILLFTDKRIIFSSSTIGNSKSKEILIKNIQSIDSKENSILGTGKLRIKGITETFWIDISIKNMNEAKKIINSFKDEKITNSNSISTADEILKFKNLLDQGIITQEEFEKKKKELLG